MSEFPLLTNVQAPSDLRQLSEQQLPELALELREFLLQSLNHCGGHLGAGLGTIELSIVLHYLFNTPNDKLIWDVGHQAYPHKILTGRRDQITTVKQTDGLAPFPKRDESPYDAFGVGHSSTSISAAIGMAAAFKQLENDQQAIAIIGDGAMTAGMAFEALNHGGDLKPNVLVILNDNEMSISPNVGALSNYLTRVLSGRLYTQMREGSKTVLNKIPPALEFMKRTEAHMKGFVSPGMLFEEFGFNYFGPVDGHNIPTLLKTLKNLQQQTGPRLLHIITKKGKGYAPAEADPVAYHAVKPGFYQQDKPTAPKASSKTYSQIFGDWLCDMAKQDDRIVGITPAMREGSGMVEFSEKFPDRYFDVGIAEQHAVTLAAGMACEGLRPVVAIYSSFLQRAYDQLIHDVALQNLPVLFAIDRAGLVGGDGSTHNGAFDLSFMQCIPNMTIMAPADENECRQMLFTGTQLDGPSAVRYPRGSGTGIAPAENMKAIPLGQAELKRQGQKIALLSFGSLLQPALEVAEQLNATVINMRFIKPIDEAILKTLTTTHDTFVTLEENSILGGAGSSISQWVHQQRLNIRVFSLGLPDHFIEHGDPAILLASCGLNAEGILDSIRQFSHHDEKCSDAAIQNL